MPSSSNQFDAVLALIESEFGTAAISDDFHRRLRETIESTGLTVERVQQLIDERLDQVRKAEIAAIVRLFARAKVPLSRGSDILAHLVHRR